MAESGHNEGKDQRRSRLPRRGFPVAIAAIAIVAAVVTTFGAFSAESRNRGTERGVVAAVTQTPGTTPTLLVTTAAATPVLTQAPATDTAAATVAPTPVPTAPATPTATAVTSSATSTPTVGDATSSTPIAVTPTPGAGLAPQAVDLRTSIEATYGVRILVEGQFWGADSADQVRYLNAIKRALETMPANVLTSVSEGAGGKLTFASNNGGRTEDGWQPYGDRAANFYSNEDRGANGKRAANQIVLQPGSSSQTIAHEILHAYQARGQAPGDYVSGLLTDEMKSFMAATGWRQLATDDEIRKSGGSWSSINTFFSYEGHSTSYLNEYGTLVSLYGPNPLEAFAEAGGLYYAHSQATTLPDWPDYWDWFATNVG